MHKKNCDSIIKKSSMLLPDNVIKEIIYNLDSKSAKALCYILGEKSIDDRKKHITHYRTSLRWSL